MRAPIEKKYRITENSEECTPLSSFRYADTVRFLLSFVDQPCPDSVILRFHRDEDGVMTLYPLALSADGIASVDISLQTLCADANGALLYYVYDVYYSDGCITFAGEEPEVLMADGENQKRQLLIYQDAYHTPAWMRGGIIYHIFVDRYYSGRCIPPKHGALLNPNWEGGVTQFPSYPGAPLANNEFFGGDLWGIAEKLDAIAALGVTVLYLSPVFDAVSNHKYDTSDYEHVDAMFGGDDALSHLIEAARDRGIGVILDGVFNHTGSDSRYFNQLGRYPGLGAAQSTASPYYPWYSFTQYPDEYDCWWGVKILPKVRCDEPSYREYILGEDGILARWMKKGIAGWRLDVADELSDAFLDTLRERVRAENPDGVIYGEVWENATNKIAYGARRRYLRGQQLDSVMNYPLKNAVIAYIRDGDTAALSQCIHTIYRQYPKESADVLMNFLSTHDTARILTELGGSSAEGKTMKELSTLHMTEKQRAVAIARLKIAYQLISCMPGLPCIFYGDEAGIEGYGDPFCRAPYPWGKEERELLDQYRQVGSFHRAMAVFRDGYIRILHLDPQCAAFLRYNGHDTPVLLLVNRGTASVAWRMSETVRLPEDTVYHTEWTLPPMSAQFCLCDTDAIQVAPR